jgi:hypothetical protein
MHINPYRVRNTKVSVFYLHILYYWKAFRGIDINGPVSFCEDSFNVFFSF